MTGLIRSFEKKFYPKTGGTSRYDRLAHNTFDFLKVAIEGSLRKKDKKYFLNLYFSHVS